MHRNQPAGKTSSHLNSVIHTIRQTKTHILHTVTLDRLLKQEKKKMTALK